jgi:hypothetical protein
MSRVTTASKRSRRLADGQAGRGCDCFFLTLTSAAVDQSLAQLPVSGEDRETRPLDARRLDSSRKEEISMSPVGRPRAKWITVALSVLATSALVGCGGDDSDDDESNGGSSAQTTTESPAPTKAEYIAAADKACAVAIKGNKPTFDEINAAIARQNAAGQAGESIAEPLREQARLWSRIVQARRELTAKLEALDPPDSGQPPGYIAARDQATKATKQHSETLVEGAGMPAADAVAAQNASGERLSAASKKALRISEKYGFKTCEQPVK